MKKLIGVVSPNKTYADRLSLYISEKENLAYYGGAFLSLEKAFEFGREKKFSILLIDQKLISVTDESVELIKKVWDIADDVIILKETKDKIPGLQFQSIFKYVSAEEIIQKALESIHSSDTIEKDKERLYSLIFSPSGRPVDKKAIEEINILKGKKRILYISYSPFEEGGSGLSEAYFGYVCGKRANLAKLWKDEGSYGKLFGVNFYEELEDMDIKGLEWIVRYYLKESEFEEVVIIAEHISNNVSKMFEEADSIYMTTWKGEEEEKRQNEFLRQLKFAGKEDVLKKIIKVCLSGV